MADEARDREPVERLKSQRLTEEDKYFYERSFKEPVESTERIEEVAKFLVGATATTSGLFLAAFKLSLGQNAAASFAWYVPFLCWAASIVALVLVLLPRKYKAGESEPQSWKKAYLAARDRKYRYLLGGALLFVAGILSAVWPLVG